MSRTFRHHRIPLRLFGAALAAATGLPTPRASASIDIHWINTRTNGDWNTASNWNLGRVPAADDDAYLSFYNPPLPVTLSADAVARSLTIGNGDRLETTGHRLDVTGAIRVVDGDNGLFVGPGSTVTAASLSLVLNNGGQITLAGGVARFGDVVTNSYPASAIAGQGTLDITGSSFANPATPWTNAGKVNVAAGGTLTLNTPAPWRSTGTITLADGSSLTGSQVAVAGRLNVQGAASITAPVYFDTAANVALSTTVGPSTLSLSGPITYAGGQYAVATGGMIRQNNTADVLISVGISGDRYDWDGASDAQTTNIHPGASLGIGVKHIQDAGADVFRGTINITNGALNVTAPWEMAGTLNLLNDPTAPSPTSGPLISGGTMTVTGTISATNAAAIYAPTRLVGATVLFTNPADALRFVAPTEFHGGSYARTGQFAFASDVSVSADTTIAANVRFTASRTITVGSLDTPTLTLAGSFAIPAGMTLTKRGPGELNVSGPQSHGLDSIIKVEAGTFRLGTDVGSASAGTTNLAVGGAGSLAKALFTSSQHLRSLQIDAGGRVEVSGTRLVTEFLSIATAAPSLTQLDVGSAALVVDYAVDAASPLADVRAYLAAGYHGGAWDGPGIVSTTARTTPGRSLGYGEAATALNLSGAQTASFLGETVDATAVLVRLTAPGDATLDGVVNFHDLLALAKNYNRPDAHWFQGDFDYSGTVNFDDLLLLAKNYSAPQPTGAVPGAAPEFTADAAAAFAAAVPEPSAAAVLGAAACGFALSARRRRGFNR